MNLALAVVVRNSRNVVGYSGLGKKKGKKESNLPLTFLLLFDKQNRQSSQLELTACFHTGAGGQNRTDMGLPPRDFESRASTNFTTPAKIYRIFEKSYVVPVLTGTASNSSI